MNNRTASEIRQTIATLEFKRILTCQFLDECPALRIPYVWEELDTIEQLIIEKREELLQAIIDSKE